MKIFPEQLKNARLLNNLSKAELASLLEIPLATYNHYETQGTYYRRPSLSLLLKIAKILNVTTDYLLGIKR